MPQKEWDALEEVPDDVVPSHRTKRGARMNDQDETGKAPAPETEQAPPTEGDQAAGQEEGKVADPASGE